MNELTDEQIDDVWAGVSDPSRDDLDIPAFARAIIAAHEAQRQAEPENFDTWSENPYTLVLHKSIAEDFVPRHEQQRQAGQEAVALVDNGTLLWNIPTPTYSVPLHLLKGQHWLYTAPLAAPVPEGYKLLPLEPTEAMIKAGGHVNSEWLNDNAPIGEARYAMPIGGVYTAMLAASPDSKR